MCFLFKKKEDNEELVLETKDIQTAEEWKEVYEHESASEYIIKPKDNNGTNSEN